MYAGGYPISPWHNPWFFPDAADKPGYFPIFPWFLPCAYQIRCYRKACTTHFTEHLQNDDLCIWRITCYLDRFQCIHHISVFLHITVCRRNTSNMGAVVSCIVFIMRHIAEEIIDIVECKRNIFL